MGHGRGSFSNLPPWERPEHLYGRGACYYPYGAPITRPIINPEDEAAILAQQKSSIETHIKNLQTTLTKIQERLNEINK